MVCSSSVTVELELDRGTTVSRVETSAAIRSYLSIVIGHLLIELVAVSRMGLRLHPSQHFLKRHSHLVCTDFRTCSADSLLNEFASTPCLCEQLAVSIPIHTLNLRVTNSVN